MGSLVQEPKTITHQKLEPANSGGIKHHLEVTYFPTHLPIYKTYYFLHKWTIVLDLP
jgi:hypothetical protein